MILVYIYIYNFRFKFKERKKYFKMNRSMKRFVLFKVLFLYFVVTYVYVSCLLLSSENIYGTRPGDWGTQ